MILTYRRVPTYSRLSEPSRRTLVSRRTSALTSRLQVWESEGGALKSHSLHASELK
jgi:hypothetical protein